MFAILQLAMVQFHIGLAKSGEGPWRQSPPDPKYRVLIAGDSTAYGYGVEDPRQSVGGLLGKEYPQALVENHSQMGMHLKALIPTLKALKGSHFDLAILMIGGNDIMFFVPFHVIEQQLGEALAAAKEVSDKIVILHSGDLGQSKLFFWPLNEYYTWSVTQVRKIYLKYQDHRVAYVDILSHEQGKSVADCFAKDLIHPNVKGYALWYAYIQGILANRQWDFPPG